MNGKNSIISTGVAKHPLDPVLQNVHFPTRTNGMNPDPVAANSLSSPPGPYVFHQGRYSEGATIREVRGNINYLKKECDSNSGCSGFFYNGTEGQLKSNIQTEKSWHTLAPKPNQGLYIKRGNKKEKSDIINMMLKQDFGENRNVRTYDMYTGIKSPGYSIKKVEMKDLRSLQQLCDSTPRCVGVGVTPKSESVIGDLKYRIQSKDRWVRESGTDRDLSDIGLYVYTGYPIQGVTEKGVFFVDGSHTYCEANNLCGYMGTGELASLDQVLSAQAGGFYSCKPGWIKETYSKGLSRPYPERRAGFVGCDSMFGTSSFQSAPINNQQKYGGYCYGDVPPQGMWR